MRGYCRDIIRINNEVRQKFQVFYIEDKDVIIFSFFEGKSA